MNIIAVDILLAVGRSVERSKVELLRGNSAHLILYTRADRRK